MGDDGFFLGDDGFYLGDGGFFLGDGGFFLGGGGFFVGGGGFFVGGLKPEFFSEFSVLIFTFREETAEQRDCRSSRGGGAGFSFFSCPVAGRPPFFATVTAHPESRGANAHELPHVIYTQLHTSAVTYPASSQHQHHQASMLVHLPSLFTMHDLNSTNHLDRLESPARVCQ